MEDRGFSRTFCKNCPFLPMMNILKKRKMAMICDAGCSILGMTRPYELGVASYGMGASIAVAARSTKLALIGDYALLHSGLNALIDVYVKRLPLLVIVMKNDCTAMTGKQPAYDPLPYLRWADPVVNRGELLQLGVLRPVIEAGGDQLIRVLADADADFLEEVRMGGLVDDRNHVGDAELLCQPAGHEVDRVIPLPLQVQGYPGTPSWRR